MREKTLITQNLILKKLSYWLIYSKRKIPLNGWQIRLISPNKQGAKPSWLIIK